METILLVDDEAGIVDTASTMLLPMGYRVRTNKNSRETVAACHDSTPAVNLVILDLIMSGMSGVEAYERSPFP